MVVEPEEPTPVNSATIEPEPELARFKPNLILQDGTLARRNTLADGKVELLLVKSEGEGDGSSDYQILGLDRQGKKLLGTRQVLSPDEYQAYLSKLSTP